MLQWYVYVPGALNVCEAEVAPDARVTLVGGGALSGTTVCVVLSPLCQATGVPTVIVVTTGEFCAASVHWMTVLFPEPEPGLPDEPFVLDPPQARSRTTRLTMRMGASGANRIPNCMTHPAPRSIPELWRPAPGRLVPAQGEVVLIGARLSVDPRRLSDFRSTFSRREEDRFQRFGTDALRSRWGAARGILREVLGRALELAPAAVRFAYGAHGKPHVVGSTLEFNISHSGDLAVIALAQVEVGVDVELPRPRRSDDIARRFYAPGEIERLFAQSDPAARADSFFRLWTCKEAFLKVTGEGLSRSTRSYEIALDPPRLLWAKGIPDAARRYSVHPLEVGDPYRGAVVAESPSASLRCYRWQ